MSTFNYPSTEETTNANRACRLLLGPCTDGLRDLLRHHVPPAQFPQVIQQHSPNLPRLTAAQRNLILPQHGHYSGNYDDMDISLLYVLLRNICNIPAHSKGWGNDPDSSDASLSANIERIRLTRNERGHSSDPSLSNNEFNILWSSLRSAVLEIDSFLGNGNQHTNQVDFLLKETMDPARDRCYVKQLRQQAEDDQETREMVDDLKIRFEKLEVSAIQNNTCPSIKQDTGIQNMIDKTQIMLRSYREKIGNLFVRTRAVSKIMDLLETNRYVFVRGNPGEGKTTLSKQILSELQEKGMRPLQMFSVTDLYRTIPICSNLAIFLDNLFGEISLANDELHVYEMQQHVIKEIVTSDNRGNKNILIVTIRNDIYSECMSIMKESPFFKNSLVDLSTGIYSLNVKELKTFVTKYDLENILTDNKLPEVLNLGKSIGIPQCLKLMKESTGLSNNVQSIFSHPYQHLKEEIGRRIRKREPKTAVLIYILLHGGNVDVEIVKDPTLDRELKLKAMEIAKIKDPDIWDFQERTDLYQGSLITCDKFDRKYRFTHSCIQESVFLFLCQYYASTVIHWCSPALLVNLEIQSPTKKLNEFSKIPRIAKICFLLYMKDL